MIYVEAQDASTHRPMGQVSSEIPLFQAEVVNLRGWGSGSAVECFASRHKTLGFVPSVANRKQETSADTL